jgi:photosystem II stability/assembly factor-like uncharacterized protein
VGQLNFSHFICLLVLWAGVASAHDPSAYGGLFRSRDFGGTWLNADVGLFLGGAVSLAVNPADPNHLLLGTDVNLLQSQSGGRSWRPVAPGTLFGAVTAVTFIEGGVAALCTTPGGIFRMEQGEWRQTDAPAGAAPARVILAGASPQRIYLVGRHDLFMSDNAGRSWQRVEHSLAAQPEFAELALVMQPAERLYAIADARLMTSDDGGKTWTSLETGLPDSPLEALTIDPGAPGRMWLASAGRIYRSDDGGSSWRAMGASLPEPDTTVRGIAADASGLVVVLATHRGLYRSTDGTQSWQFLEGNLPVHLEAKPLIRDPANLQTLYAGYALLPYGEIWRIAVEGGNLLGRLSIISLIGAVAFLLLLAIGGWLAARRLAGRRSGRTRGEVAS